MLKRIVLIALLAASAGMAACGALRPGFETPTVTLSSFRPVPSSGAVPAFEIGLHVVNPNRTPLELAGMTYTISLEGHELVKGVSNRMPEIEGYGEGDINLTARPNLLGGIRLVSDLMSGPRNSFAWEFEAKLDLGGFNPAIRITESGTVSLAAGGGR